MIKRKSAFSETQIREAVSRSLSVSDVVIALNRSPSGTMWSIVKKYIDLYNVDTSHFKRCYGQSPFKIPAEVLFSKKSKYRISGSRLREAMISVGVQEKCSICGIPPSWNNTLLVLEVDHINGDWSDNALSNLRLVCPNCHSQLPTSKHHTKEYAARHALVQKICIMCNNEYFCAAMYAETRTMCGSVCTAKYASSHAARKTKIIWPPPEMLKRLVANTPLSKIAKSLGVSDRAVKKHCDKFGIPTRGRGQWTKDLNNRIAP